MNRGGVSSFSAAARRFLSPALLLVFPFVLLVLSGTGCSRPDLEESFVEYLDARIPRLMDRFGIPGVSIALISEGAPVWTGSYGYADLEEGRRMTTDMVCRTESISKSVTAWGIMRLAEEGSIDLQAPVTGHVGGWKLPVTEYPPGEITFERLLSNSAGLPLGTIGPEIEYSPGEEMPSVREYLEGEIRLIQEPGKGFVYSNVGFNLMEYSVEKITGREFSRYMAEEILEPLGMETAGYGWREEFAGRVPQGYENDGTPVDPYVYPVTGSGGLMATVDDIARFAAAGMTDEYFGSPADRVLSEESIRAIHTPRVEIPGIFGVVADSYGFGHFIETLPDGQQAIWHGGQGHGWMTHFHIIPEAGEGIVILTNSQRSWPFLALLLDKWAEWNGFSSVKMGNITTANRIVTALLAAILAAALWMTARLVLGLIGGGRRFAPLARTGRTGRFTAAAAGLAVVAVVAWRSTLPYRFETSIFPTIIGWGTTVLVFFSIVLIISVLFPRDSDRLTGKRVRQ